MLSVINIISNSIIIQWGQTSTQQTTYFPVSFTNTAYTVVAIVNYYANFPNNINFSVTVGSLSTTGCYFRGVSSGTTIHGMGYIAVGY